MRFQRSFALAGVALVWLALGPWPVLALAGLLGLPRVRDWLRPTRVAVAGWVAAVAALAGLVIVVPDAWLPIPAGSGAWVTPGYVGRPAFARPLRLDVPAHPGLAVDGAGPSYDAWASGASTRSGPLGESPEVTTAWFGRESCAGLMFDRHGRMVAVCGAGADLLVRVLDQESLHPLVTKELPEAEVPDDRRCGRASYLDSGDRLVVATTDRRLLTIDTDDAEGAPDLTTVAVRDLADQVPADDCVVALLPDWSGRIWFATLAGRVGVLPAGRGAARLVELEERLTQRLSLDAEGGVYAATDEAVYRISAGRSSAPTVRWRTPATDPTTPTLLAGGLVASTDEADDQLAVVALDRADGARVCSARVLGENASAGQGLVSTGSGVIVANTAGAGGPLGTRLGMTGDGGVARVEVRDGDCVVAWRTDVVAPRGGLALSQQTGLLYAVTKPHSWWGTNAWFLTALDARTGRVAFSVRTGRSNRVAATDGGLALGPEGGAYVAARAGIVRVHDRILRGN